MSNFDKQMQTLRAAMDESQAAVRNVVSAVRAEREIVEGYDRSSAAMFTLGYVESLFAGVLSELPAASRRRVLDDLRQTTDIYQARVAAAKETV